MIWWIEGMSTTARHYHEEFSDKYGECKYFYSPGGAKKTIQKGEKPDLIIVGDDIEHLHFHDIERGKDTHVQIRNRINEWFKEFQPTEKTPECIAFSTGMFYDGIWEACEAGGMKHFSKEYGEQKFLHEYIEKKLSPAKHIKRTKPEQKNERHYNKELKEIFKRR
jgi:hypothetical protein